MMNGLTNAGLWGVIGAALTGVGIMALVALQFALPEPWRPLNVLGDWAGTAAYTEDAAAIKSQLLQKKLDFYTNRLSELDRIVTQYEAKTLDNQEWFNKYCGYSELFSLGDLCMSVKDTRFSTSKEQIERERAKIESNLNDVIEQMRAESEAATWD